MIGKLKGVIEAYGEDWVLLDVNGVCYEVHCSARTLAGLPQKGEAAILSIETYVREDQIRLFGFASEAERAWFRLLQSVQGVGAKVALGVLGTLSPQDLANAVALQDKAQVARSPGVGPKVAQRIVAELKDKIPDMALSGAPGAALAVAGEEAPPAPPAAADAVSALTNLGYAHAQASAAVAAAARKAGDASETAELIRLGLKELAG
ncbi:MAG: Holliday junction branch migration protein RuvA [Alphaproteobacteria bacterium]|nr:MAG: Holliday junction branch migration protein RuvA [Alphaproteobacteria bacterium]